MAVAGATHLHTDHWVDAVCSLEAADDFAVRATTDERFWKWLLIAQHSAVQGFMALALEHGNSLLVMRDDVRRKWLDAHEKGAAYPDERMDYFPALYEKVKSNVVCRYVGSKKFVPGTSHDYSMGKLNELRNGFIHFMPKAWAIELAGLPKVCLDALDVAHFLGWESMTIIWHDSALRERAGLASTRLRESLNTLSKVYGHAS
jgi:hypothetical protein